MYEFTEAKILTKNIVISHILGPENEEHNEPFINNNLVKNINHDRLAKNQWIAPQEEGQDTTIFWGTYREIRKIEIFAILGQKQILVEPKQLNLGQIAS